MRQGEATLPPSIDTRLGPILAELEANPQWLGGGSAADVRVVRSYPVLDSVCLELRGESKVFAEVGLVDDRPLLGGVIVIEDPEPRVTLQRENPVFVSQPHVCAFVATAMEQPGPSVASEIEVNGGLIRPEDEEIIRQALLAQPGTFGALARGPRAINLQPQRSSGGEDCYQAVVYVSGPVARVAIVMSADQPRGIARVVVAEQGWMETSAPC
ncbi:hypothetical protein BH20CHL6_BH20CHL6_03870 [soil metagenome]